MAPRLAPVFVFSLLATGAAAQKPVQTTGQGLGEAETEVTLDVAHKVTGTIKDLALDSQGRILFCTAERRVGRIVPGGPVSILAYGQAQFPNPPVAVAETPGGDVAVLDSAGHVLVLFGGMGPAVKVYDDLYMIGEPTDLIVDARGSYLIASATPSSGQRAMNWVQNDGQRWGYYLVKHQPLALAHDPLTGGIVMSETTSGGNLRLVTAGSPIRATTALDVTTHPGLTVSQSDGDVACEADGDVFWIAGGRVYRRSRATGTTVVFPQVYDQLRGVVIAESTGWQPSPTGWSLYVAEGAQPTRLREITGVDAPGAVIANDQGAVPGRGVRVNVTFGFQALELTADNQGRLLLGGTQFGSSQFVKRVTLTGTPSIATVANSSNGLVAPVEGLVVAADDSIFALARTGVIQRITEGPLAVTTVFTDPLDQISVGKDMVRDVDGTFYVATRDAWDFGKVFGVSGGSATLLTLTQETRGLAANPLGGLFISQWNNSGFAGTVDLFHFDDGSIEALPGFSALNYTNDFGWGDGDICVDANGAVYTVSEDDWGLVRYEPALDGFVRVGSGYLNHPSGLVIAPSTAGSGSSTGWSLYVSEFDNLWEKPSVQPPASTVVDASLGFAVGRTLAGAPHPRYGKPRALTQAPGGERIVIGTAAGWLLLLDPTTGDVRPLAGPESGLRGALVALAPTSGGRGLRALNAEGEVFELAAQAHNQSGTVRKLPLAPDAVAPALERALARGQHTLALRDRLTAREERFVLEGWVVWRVAPE